MTPECCAAAAVDGLEDEHAAVCEHCADAQDALFDLPTPAPKPREMR